jgi:hypothetical protein
MEVLFYFIFELFKIALLASIYAAIVLGVFIIIGKQKPNSLFNQVLQKKTQLWFFSAFIFSVLLFGIMFSHWGNHGLGDSARIPLAQVKAVRQTNSSLVYITASGYEMEVLNINEFAITDEYLFAKINSNRPAAINKEIAVWDLNTNEVAFLDQIGEIENLKIKYNITEPLYFADFQEQYIKHWNGWRFIFLP